MGTEAGPQDWIRRQAPGELHRCASETHEIVYGPDGQTVRGERTMRTIDIDADPGLASGVPGPWVWAGAGAVLLLSAGVVVAATLLSYTAPPWAVVLLLVAGAVLVLEVPTAILRAWRPR